MSFFRPLSDITYKDGIFVNLDNRAIQDLESVSMVKRITKGDFHFVVNLSMFALGLLTFGIAWLYFVWKIYDYFKNINKYYLGLKFKNKSQIIENNDLDVNQDFFMFKREDKVKVEEKYNELKSLAETYNKNIVFNKLQKS